MPETNLASTGLSKGELRYREQVAYFLGQENKVLGSLLRLYWERGRFAGELLSRPDSYGNHTAEQFGIDISRDKTRPYKAEAVRVWFRFYKKYSQEELEEVIKQKLPWREISTLLAINNRAKRHDLQVRLATREIDSKYLRGEVKNIVAKQRQFEIKEGRNPDKRGGASAYVLLRKTTRAMTPIFEVYDDAMEAVSTHNKMDKNCARAKELSIFRKEVLNNVLSAAKKLNELILALKESN